MTKVTVLFQTDQPKIDPSFFDNLNILAERYGIRMKSETAVTDSAQFVRLDRDERDHRDAERAAASGGLRKDLSHLDLYRD